MRSFGPANLVTLGAVVRARRAGRIPASSGRSSGGSGEPCPVAVALIAGSAAMALADGAPEERDARAGGTAATRSRSASRRRSRSRPGVSRNGATLTAARLLRFRRADANVISRQIALPVILGAAALKGARLAQPRRAARDRARHGRRGGDRVRLDAALAAADHDARAQPLAAPVRRLPRRARGRRAVALARRRA